MLAWQAETINCLKSIAATGAADSVAVVHLSEGMMATAVDEEVELAHPVAVVGVTAGYLLIAVSCFLVFPCWRSLLPLSLWTWTFLECLEVMRSRGWEDARLDILDATKSPNPRRQASALSQWDLCTKNSPSHDVGLETL